MVEEVVQSFLEGSVIGGNCVGDDFTRAGLSVAADKSPSEIGFKGEGLTICASPAVDAEPGGAMSDPNDKLDLVAVVDVVEGDVGQMRKF